MDNFFKVIKPVLWSHGYNSIVISGVEQGLPPLKFISSTNLKGKKKKQKNTLFCRGKCIQVVVGGHWWKLTRAKGGRRRKKFTQYTLGEGQVYRLGPELCLKIWKKYLWSWLVKPRLIVHGLDWVDLNIKNSCPLSHLPLSHEYALSKNNDRVQLEEL